jgi:hypothetical protein
MAKATHKWAFKPGMRAGAYSWKSSSKAIERLKSASSEIRAVARVDPVTAAEGVIALAQRIWPAFEHIDTSSGALGNAVRRTLEELLPVLIEAPADEKTRAKWLEQLREAIEDDGVDYLAPIADRFGQIATYPSLMNLHADRDLDMIEAAWSDHAHFIHVPTATLTLSCLVEAGRYDELLALLERKIPASGSMRSSEPKPCCVRAAQTRPSPALRRCSLISAANGGTSRSRSSVSASW